MFNFEKLRLPYREDSAFSCLSFLVFIVPLAFFILTNENYETAKFSLFLILTGCALVSFLKRQNKGGPVLAYSRLLFILLGLLLALAVLSTVFSTDILYSIFGFYYRFTDSLVFYLLLSTFLILLISILDRAKLKFLFKILVFDALIVAVVACLQAFGVTYYAGASAASGLILGPSLLGNPDFSAMFLAAVLPFTLVFLIGAEKFAAKVYYALCVFIILLASLVFASRGALLAIIISLILGLLGLLVFHLPKKLFFGLLFLFLIVGLSGGLALKITRPGAISTVFKSVDSNTIDRIVAWEVSVKGIGQRPLLGSGPGTFALFFERSRPQSLAGEVGVFDDPHNLFLRMAVTEGLPFTLVFLGLIGAAVYGGYRKLKQERDLLPLGCLTGLVAWGVAACFNPVPVPMFVVLGVLLAGLFLNPAQKKDFVLKPWYKFPAYFLAAVFIICGISLIASEYVFGFAKRDYLNGNYAGAYRLSVIALKINPTNRLYDIYRIGGEIGMGQNAQKIGLDINNFIQIHSGRAGTYVAASDLYSLLAQKTGNKLYLRTAISEMDKALGIDKYYGERYGQEALYYYELGDFASAKMAVIKNLSISGDDFSPWVLLARLYQLEGEKAQTVFALTRAFKLRPDIPQLEYILYLAKTQKDIKLVPIQIAAQSPGLE